MQALTPQTLCTSYFAILSLFFLLHLFLDSQQGAAWTNFVNTRLVISLLSKSLIGGHDGMHAVTTSVRRRLSVAFSPHVPNDSVDFLVTHYGVDGISTVDDVCKAAVDT